MKKTLNILIAEDEPEIANFMCEMMESKGHKTSWAENGKRALNIYLNNSNYDLIFTDVQMPVMDGPTFVSEIRSYELTNKLNKVPVVFMTGNKKAGDELKKAGEYVMFKPIYFDNVMSMLEKYSI